ncbi:UBX domain-containing protein 6-like [Dorcoceras hygrometricum]|uniref:UBX domain-containing protein 6-like n=1 Tax=Dorcoceras hygrometricum TaxID=472368 RepID=A0A2Z7B895_9LAMI|nr:UBX domain-containing protein 6-like [Dorcoceras hygrometricum]
MSSPDSSIVRKVAESIDSPSLTGTGHREDEISSSIELHRDRLLRIDHDDARLAAQGCIWYEVKTSTLRDLNLPLIKDKVGISELYEVVVPRVEVRAHRPPVGFHTFSAPLFVHHISLEPKPYLLSAANCPSSKGGSCLGGLIEALSSRASLFGRGGAFCSLSCWIVSPSR